jgi:hypothetical protein
VRHLLVAITFAGLLGGSAALAQDDPPEPRQIAWKETLKQALDQAKEQKLPVLVAMLSDNEPSCRKIAEHHYADPALIDLLAKVPCVIASPNVHEPTEQDGRAVCSRFGTVTCAQHCAAYEELNGLLYRKRTPVIPQHLLLDETGEIVDSRPFYVPPETLRRWLVRALKRLRPDLLAPADLEERGDALVENSLFDQLQFGTTEQRQHAASLLDDMEAETVARALEGYVSRLNSVGRERLLSMIADCGMSCASYFLSRYLTSNDPGLRVAAAIGFQHLGSEQPLGALLLRLESEQDSRARAALLLAIGRCGSHSPRARSVVLQVGAGGDTQARLAALLALGDLDPNPEVVSLLVHNVESKDPRLARAAIWSAGKLRLKDAAAPIERILSKLPDRTNLLAELALKLIRGESVDETFYAEQKPSLDEGESR